MSNNLQKTLRLTPTSQSFAESANESNATDSALARAHHDHQQRLLALSTDFATRKQSLQAQYVSEVTQITNGGES